MRGGKRAEWAEAAARRATQMRASADQSRAFALQAREPQPDVPRPATPPVTCPDCGEPMVAGAGCGNCFGGTAEEAARAFAAAEESWSAATGAHHSAGQEHARAETAWESAVSDWTEAEARHADAVRQHGDAQERWRESQATTDQAAVEWEAAQTVWQRARERESE